VKFFYQKIEKKIEMIFRVYPDSKVIRSKMIPAINRLNDLIRSYINTSIKSTLEEMELDYQEEVFEMYDEVWYNRLDIDEYVVEFIDEIQNKFLNDDDHSNFYDENKWYLDSIVRLDAFDMVIIFNEVIKWYKDTFDEFPEDRFKTMETIINTYAYWFVEQNCDSFNTEKLRDRMKVAFNRIVYPEIPNYPHSCVVCLENKELFGICAVCVSGKVCKGCAIKLLRSNEEGSGDTFDCPICRQSFVAEMYGKPDSCEFINWHWNFPKLSTQLKETTGMMAEDTRI